MSRSNENGGQIAGSTVTVMKSPTSGKLGTVAPISTGGPSLTPTICFSTGATAATALLLLDQTTLSVTSLVVPSEKVPITLTSMESPLCTDGSRGAIWIDSNFGTFTVTSLREYTAVASSTAVTQAVSATRP